MRDGDLPDAVAWAASSCRWSAWLLAEVALLRALLRPLPAEGADVPVDEALRTWTAHLVTAAASVLALLPLGTLLLVAGIEPDRAERLRQAGAIRIVASADIDRLALGAAETLIDQVGKRRALERVRRRRPVDQAVVVESGDLVPVADGVISGTSSGIDTDSALGITSAEPHGPEMQLAPSDVASLRCACTAHCGSAAPQLSSLTASIVWSAPTSSIAALISESAMSAAFSPGGP